MKTILVIFLLVSITLATPLLFTEAFAQTNIDGFSGERARAERRWEELFRAVPNPKSAREHLRILTLEPHIAGTKEDYDTAVYVRDQLRSYGLTADLKEYDVWLNYPNTPSVLELITTRRQRLNTHEAVVPGDPSSSHPKITPLFNGYSASGDVTAPIVYVNYGLPEDYATLDSLGVSVRGKVVVARYGRSFRGIKAREAERHLTTLVRKLLAGRRDRDNLKNPSLF